MYKAYSQTEAYLAVNLTREQKQSINKKFNVWGHTKLITGDIKGDQENLSCIMRI